MLNQNQILVRLEESLTPAPLNTSELNNNIVIQQNIEQANTLRRRFAYIAADTTKFQMVVMPFLNNTWFNNIDSLIAEIKSCAKYFSSEDYQECIETFKYYINGQGAQLCNRFTSTFYLFNTVEVVRESPALKLLNQKLDHLILENKRNQVKQNISWKQQVVSLAKQGKSVIWSIVKYAKKNPVFVVSTLLLAQSGKTRASAPTDGLIAYYPFNGNALDESGNQNLESLCRHF